MMFDNSIPEQPSTWEQVKAHVPILLAVGGALALFVSMHTGAFVVAGLGAIHLVLGGAILLISNLRRRKQVRS